MDFYMADSKYCFMVCRNLCQVHFQEEDLTQILTQHIKILHQILQK